MVDLKTGDLIELKKKYHGNGKFAIILSVQICESLKQDGWITFDYKIMTNFGNVCSIISKPRGRGGSG